MKRVSFFLSLLLTLSACGLLPPAATVTPTPANTPTATITPSPTATLTPTPSIPKTFDSAPETITATLPPDEEGGQAREVELNKANLSTVFDNLVIYRDADNNAQMVMVLGTGEVKTLRDAGIAELDLTTGEKLEMRLFDSIESAHEYVLANSLRMFGDVTQTRRDYPEVTEPIEQAIEIEKSIIRITGEQNGYNLRVPTPEAQLFYYNLGIRVLEDGRTILRILKKDKTCEFILLNNKVVESTDPESIWDEVFLKITTLDTDLSLKLKRLSRISAQKAIFAADFVKPWQKAPQDSESSPIGLTC